MNGTTLSVLASAVLTSVLSAQQLVQLPDNHHLGESATQAHASGSANWFGGATALGRRFQVLYDASHFTGIGGVNSAILLQHLRLRGEDTEHNAGGQTYSNVEVHVYSTTLSSALALNGTFANNLPPIVASSTELTPAGGVLIPLLVVAPSIGRAPNNDIIDIDLSTSPMLPYDPTGLQPNLLIDIRYASATVATDPQGSVMVALQDTTGVIAHVRGRGLYAASAIAANGTASSLPPTIRVEYIGSGGFPALVPARNERFGAACGGAPSSFYQLFAHDTYFDLKDLGQMDGLAGLRLIPDQYPDPNTYLVVGGAGPVNLLDGLLAVPTTTGDDDTMVHALPAATNFDFVGSLPGGTNVIRAATNGYVIVDPASAEGTAVPGNFAADYAPTVAKLLGSGATHLARFAPFWHDFSPNKNATPLLFSDPLAGLHVVNNVLGSEVLITWYRVGRYNSVGQVFQEEHTMQCSLNWATGIVEFRYGPMDEIWGDTFSGAVSGVTGFSPGRTPAGVPMVDPQSRDLSIERPFVTLVEGATGNVGLVSRTTTVAGGPTYMGRGFVGQTMWWDVSNVPPTTLIGVTLLDWASTRPGYQGLPIFPLPGCLFSLTGGFWIHDLHFPVAASMPGINPFPIPAGYQPLLMGVELNAQFVGLDFLPLANVSSNAIKHTIGNN